MMSEIKKELIKLEEGESYIAKKEAFVITNGHTCADMLRFLLGEGCSKQEVKLLAEIEKDTELGSTSTMSEPKDMGNVRVIDGNFILTEKIDEYSYMEGLIKGNWHNVEEELIDGDPFTLEWWLFYRDYARGMWWEVDDVTDKCAMNDCEISDEECDAFWEQWYRYTELEKWITKRIIKKYG